MTMRGRRALTALTSCTLALCLASGCSGSPTQQPEQPASEQQDQDKNEEQTVVDSSDDTSKKNDSDKKKPSGKSEKKVTYDKKHARQLQEEIQARIDATNLHVCASVLDLTNGMPVGCNGDESVTSASMIKMIIAHTVLEQAAAGSVSLDDSYTLQGSDLVGGTGSLSGRGAGAAVTYRELVQRMISESDNTATNVLIRTVGMDTINQDAQKLGLTGTQVNRFMMDYDAIAQGIENHVTSNDLALLFQMVYENTFVNEEMSALVLDALKNQQDPGGIRQGLPAEAVFAHKTGTLNGARHDGGIVLGDHPFVLVVLCTTEGTIDEGAAHTVMGDIARIAQTSLTASAS